jgi:hypothetical protein
MTTSKRRFRGEMAYHQVACILTTETRLTKDLSPAIWELLSNKWNDPKYIVETECMPDIHSDFASDELITYFDIRKYVAATPEKCQGKFSSMMVEDLNRIISNWERSGQGNGGLPVLGRAAQLHEDDGTSAVTSSCRDSDDTSEVKSNGDVAGGRAAAFGSLSNRKREASMDQIHSFASGSQSYHLYLWKMLDKHGLLGSSLQRLDDDISKAIPSVIVGAGGVSVTQDQWSSSRPGLLHDHSVSSLNQP